jgi:hypothetical protein
VYRNLVRNTEWSGAVPGAPGSAPRRITLFDDPPMAGNGVSSQLVGVAVESGLRKLNWRFWGSAGGEGNIGVDTAGLVAVQPGEWLTHSCYVGFSALPNPDLLPAYTIQINEYDAGGGFLTANTVAFTPAMGPIRAQRRASSVRIGAGAAKARALIGLYYAPGQIFDFTLGLAAPQLERSARVTTPQRRLAL